MTRVLAIDTGTTSGAAADSESGRPTFFTWHGARWQTKGEFGARLSEFRKWLDALVVMTSPDLIVFEAPLPQRGDALTNFDTVRFLYAAAGVVELVAHDREIDCAQENVGTIKAQFAGSGRADKAAVMFRCRQLGWNVRNHNEADAAALWFVAKATADPTWSVPILGGPR